MRRTVLVLVAVVMGLAAPAFAQESTAVARGEKVFTAQKCTICHMVAGKGNKNGPLDNVGSKLSADDIRQWVTNAPVMAAKVKAERKPAMKAYPNIAAADLDDLVAYLQSLKKG